MNLKKITDRIGYFPIAFFLFSVVGILYFFNHREYLDPSEYYKLKRQLTPDKKYYIYEYARYGAAYTGDISGCRLIKRCERFAENAGKSFPFGLEAWLSKDTVLVHSYFESEQVTDTFPQHTRYDNIKNIVIKQDSYKSSGGGINKYMFDSLKVSNGKLTILGIHNVLDESIISMTFPLGPITVSQHAGKISEIEIRITLKSYDDDAHTHPSIFSDGYVFTPTKSIPLNELGEIGYYLSLL